MADHAMPKGIRREAKGVYVTLDGVHRIVQEGKVWKLVEVTGDTQVGIGDFNSRGDALRELAVRGLLPIEQPKAETKPEQPKAEATPDPTPAPAKPKRQRSRKAA